MFCFSLSLLEEPQGDFLRYLLWKPGQIPARESWYWAPSPAPWLGPVGVINLQNCVCLVPAICYFSSGFLPPYWFWSGFCSCVSVVNCVAPPLTCPPLHLGSSSLSWVLPLLVGLKIPSKTCILKSIKHYWELNNECNLNKNPYRFLYVHCKVIIKINWKYRRR